MIPAWGDVTPRYGHLYMQAMGASPMAFELLGDTFLTSVVLIGALYCFNDFYLRWLFPPFSTRPVLRLIYGKSFNNFDKCGSIEIMYF